MSQNSLDEPSPAPRLTAEDYSVDEPPPVVQKPAAGLVQRRQPVESGPDIYLPEKEEGFRSEFGGSIEFKLAPAAEQAAQKQLYNDARKAEDQKANTNRSRELETRYNSLGVALIVLSVLGCLAGVLSKYMPLLSTLPAILFPIAGLVFGLAGAGLLALARQHDKASAAITGALFAATVLTISGGSAAMLLLKPNVDAVGVGESSEGGDMVKDHLAELNRIADEQERKRRNIGAGVGDGKAIERRPPENGQEPAEAQAPPRNPFQIPGVNRNPFREQPRDNDEPINKFGPKGFGNGRIPIGPAFKIIQGDPDGDFQLGKERAAKQRQENLPERRIFAPEDEQAPGLQPDADNAPLEDTVEESGDLIEQFNRMLGVQGAGKPRLRRREAALVRNRWIRGSDIEKNPALLERYESSELIGQSSANGRAMTDRRALIGFDFIDDPRLIWISPVFESDPVAIETAASSENNYRLAGMKIAFDGDKIVGVQGIFAPKLVNVLNMDKTENGIWRGERTDKVVTCLSTGRPVYGLVVYRGPQNVVGIKMLAR